MKRRIEKPLIKQCKVRCENTKPRNETEKEGKKNIDKSGGLFDE